MKKEIPILYSTMMAKAKVEKRKTQTRRSSGLDEINTNPDQWQFVGELVPNHKQKPQPVFRFMHKESKILVDIQCPYGQPGDLLWGRESVCESFSGGDYLYKTNYDDNSHASELRWKPSIHMPKEAARIWDEVISVKVERVADISVEDCIAEGIEYWNIDKDAFEGGELVADYKNYTWVDDEKHPEYWSPTFANAKYSYRSLWQLINGKPKAIQQKQNGKLITTSYIVYPFDAEAGKEFEGLTTWKGKPLTVVVNPWVWVIESRQLSVTGKPSYEI